MSRVFYVSDKSDCFESCVENVGNVLSGSGLFGLFGNKVSGYGELQEFFVSIYEDRVNDDLEGVDLRINYEEGVSLVILNLDDLDLRQFNMLLNNLLPTLNLIAFDYKDFVHFGPEVPLWSQLRQEIGIVSNKMDRMEYWMYYNNNKAHNEDPDHINNSDIDNNGKRDSHSSSVNHLRDSCTTSIYSMWSHFNTYESTNISKKNTVHIPNYIRSIDFRRIIDKHVSPTDEQINYPDILSNWAFAANDLNTSELIYCAFLILKLLVTEFNAKDDLLSDNELFLLLFTTEASYHKVNKFHNFKHAVDVMQATWKLSDYLLPKEPQYSLSRLLLSLAAIGHDMAHPGTNNNILIKHNSYLSIHYNNESVLENFHFFIFENLLFDQLNDLNIIKNQNIVRDAILATDMAKHNFYVEKLDNFEKTKPNSGVLTPMQINDMISFIIKAADISNVTRPLYISAQWAFLISLEFKDCETLEQYIHSKGTIAFQEEAKLNESDIKNILALPTDKLLENYPDLSNSQLFFIDVFAEEFFNKLTQKFPILMFLSDNIRFNKDYWLKHKQQPKT